MCRMVAGSRGVGCAVGPRYGIEATRMPRMASSNAPHSQPTASEQTEPVDCLERILRTRRMESACGTEKRAHGPLVNSNQEGGYVAHGDYQPDLCVADGSNLPVTLFHSAARLSRSSAPLAPRARSRTLTTKSTAGKSCWCRRNDSRIILRNRLR